MRNKKGLTYIELLSSVLIFFFISQLFLSLIFAQKMFFNEKFLSGEYRRQLIFAESYLKRDFFSSTDTIVKNKGEIQIKAYSGDLITYYLANDPYGEESWLKKSSKTLYRKVEGENAQPITQFCTEFLASEEIHEYYKNIKVEIIADSKKIYVEEYYENKEYE